ncbi:DEAD/DEAH box helicase [bacterium]|nr:DEAD/DEAH box helicase [bacterium]
MLKLNEFTATGFDRFALHDHIVRGIAAAGFDTPRPIQDETIPAGLAGRDVLGLAQTGTGKTAAFTLPLLHRLLERRSGGPRALILAPTRELATQIAEEIRVLARFTDLKLTTIFGGVPVARQARALRGRPEIIVGCPGRVLDLVEQDLLHLHRIETLVLDEADQMFDMGFLPGIRRILAELPARRQNLLFSATMPKEVRRLADELLHRPHVVELANRAPAATIDHALVLVGEDRKRDLLEHLLETDGCASAIVFTRTKHRARRLATQLGKAGYKAVGLQGNLSQAQRDRAMRGFRSRKFDILVATDIAARGIDVSGVTHVINYDVPNTPEAYTHRIGRTGRAEQEGVACTFVTGADHGWLRATERMIGAPIARREIEGFTADQVVAEPGRTGRRRSRRGGSGMGPGAGRSAAARPAPVQPLSPSPRAAAPAADQTAGNGARRRRSPWRR